MGKACKFKPASDKAKQFMKDNIAIDAQNIIGLYEYPDHVTVVEYMDRARDNGITAMSLTCQFDPQTMSIMLTNIAHTLSVLRDNSDRFMHVKNGDDIREAHRLGKLGVMFNTQGSENLAGNSELIAIEKALGFSHHMMAYNLRYPVGDGCYMNEDIGGIGGLTGYGKEVIASCVKNKLIVDLSHASLPLTEQAHDYLKEIAPGTPYIYSHSNHKTACDYVRSINDDQIIRMAESGGSIGLVFFAIMFTPDGYGPIKTEQVIAAINHVRDLVGVDYIHLASDDCDDILKLDNWGAGNVDTGTGKNANDIYPDGNWVYDRCQHAIKSGEATDIWEPAKTWAALADALWEEGYSDEDISKIFGGNILRTYDAVL